jgi:hypothetical protein
MPRGPLPSHPTGTSARSPGPPSAAHYTVEVPRATAERLERCAHRHGLEPAAYLGALLGQLFDPRAGELRLAPTPGAGDPETAP